jgi:hypothetical protein
MNASKPHTRKYTIEYVALDAQLEAGSITLTHDNIDDDAYMLDDDTRTTLAVKAAISTTGDGWHVAPLRRRTTQYIELTDDDARIMRTTEISVPSNYTLLQRDLNGQKQYALVSNQLMPHIPKRTRVI